MSDFSNAPVMPAAPEPFYKIWIKALTKPSEQTFAEMAASSNAKATTGYLWYFLAALVQIILGTLVQSAAMKQLMEQYGSQYGQFATDGGLVTKLISALCGGPIGAGVGVLFFALLVALVQWIAKMFGGRGTNDQLVYAMSAILSPYLLVSSILTLLAAIPYAGYCFSLLGLLAGLYVLVLEVMAVKGVNQFGWGQALASLFAPLLVFVCLCGCLIVGMFTLLGPIISDTFQQIQQGLGQ
ncbi:MAG: YIP1 family protein [Chloroflexi bacterium]|nr:YIP1 family protein [Chloroflexota bacterium]